MAVKYLNTISNNNYAGALLNDEKDPNFFKTIYTDYEKYVRSTLYWLVGENAVDDLLQEVFVKIWKNLSKFRNDSTIKTWVYRITINTAYDYFRKEKKQKLSAFDSVVSGNSPSIENAIVIKDIIKKGILMLPYKQRCVFVLFYKEDLNTEEISKALNLPVGTVKSRLFNGRSIFIEYLKKNGVNPWKKNKII